VQPVATCCQSHTSISQLLWSCCYLFIVSNSGLLSVQRPRPASHAHFRHSHIPNSRAFNTTTTTTVLRPFFRDHPGEPVPEENFWTLWCKRRLTEADTPPIQLGATPSGLSSKQCPPPPSTHVFYRPDALPATTVSKALRQLVHSD